MNNGKNESEYKGDLKFAPHDPPCTVTFHDKDNKTVGRLEFADGVMKFHGELEPSASLFFEWLTENMVNPYMARKVKKIIAALEERKKIDTGGGDFDETFNFAVDLCIEEFRKEFKKAVELAEETEIPDEVDVGEIEKI